MPLARGEGGGGRGEGVERGSSSRPNKPPDGSKTEVWALSTVDVPFTGTSLHTVTSGTVR